MAALWDALSFVQTAIEEQTEKVAGMLKDERGEKNE